MNEQEVIYAAGDVYRRLGIRDSTLRKYVKVLADEGYEFEKDQQGRRKYTNRDIKGFEQLIELSRYDGMTLEKAAKFIVQQLDFSKEKEDESDEFFPFPFQKQYAAILERWNQEQEKNLLVMEKRLQENIVHTINSGIQEMSVIVQNLADKEAKRILERDERLLQTFRLQQENKKFKEKELQEQLEEKEKQYQGLLQEKEIQFEKQLLEKDKLLQEKEKQLLDKDQIMHEVKAEIAVGKEKKEWWKFWAK